jgi:hypothetical protein
MDGEWAVSLLAEAWRRTEPGMIMKLGDRTGLSERRLG